MKLKKAFCLVLSVLITGVCGMTSVYAASPQTTQPTLYGGEIVSHRGQEITVPVYIANNPGIASLRMDLTYNTEVFSLVKTGDAGEQTLLIERGDVLNSGNITSKESENGCQIFWWSEKNKTQNGTLFFIHLKISEEAEYGDYEINISYYPKDTGNENEELVEFVCQEGYVKVESNESMVYAGTMKLRTGETTDFPFYIKNNPGISAIMLYVRFNASVTGIEAVLDESGDIIVELGDFSTKGSVIVNEYLSGWKILWYTTEGNQYGDGKLFTIRFKAGEGAAERDVPVSVTYMPDNTIDADGNKVEILNTEKGTIKIRGTHYGDIDENLKVDFADALCLKRYIAGWEGFQNININNADLNGDGKVDSADLIILERHIAGWKGYDLMQRC